MLRIPVLSAHIDGLRDQGSGSGGDFRRSAAVVIGLAVVLTLIAVIQGWDLSDAVESLLGAFSITAGVLMGVFALLASWRDRLEGSSGLAWDAQTRARREVRSAASHALFGVLLSVVGSVLVVALQTLGEDSALRPYVSGVTLGLGAYLAYLMVLIVSSMHAGFEASGDVDLADHDRRDRDSRRSRQQF